MTLFGLLACGGAPTPAAPEASAPAAVVATAPGAPSGPATGPAPGSATGAAPADRTLDLTVHVLGLDAAGLHLVGPWGETTLPVAPGAVPSPAPKAGETWNAECEPGTYGPRRILRLAPHHGLAIAYGTVATLTDTELRFDDGRSFVRHPWSDLPDGAAPGDFLGVKVYHTPAWQGHAAGLAILNARRHPGHPEAQGVSAALAPSWTVHTLAGPWQLPAAGAAPVGTGVTVRYTLTGDTPTHVSWAPTPLPLHFTGKLSQTTPSPGQVAVVDVWGNLYGVVPFTLAPGVVVPEGTHPGDLLDVAYHFDTTGHPVAESLTPRRISPVWFGHVDRVDGTTLALTTLQNQAHEAHLDGDTFLPEPVHVGDMADVVWADDPARAVAVVKE